MAGEAHQHQQIMRAAGTSLVTQRAGGRRAGSIGRRSAALKRDHLFRKLVRISLAVGGIVVAAMVAGLILDGIGWTGIIVTMLAMVGAVSLLGTFPRIKVPTIDSLSSGDTKTLVGQTELWLERQRPALPAPAVSLVDQIGSQLDALGLQLDGLDSNTPAAHDVRKLVGETLPNLVSTYTSIPRHLRAEQQAGRSPDQQLTESLGKISTEIDSVTRQLAAGAIDNLAIQTRYLDYKYGEGLDTAEQQN
ncbi:hypothetical protein [Novosphingobium sp.]|uniref:hypothetical protein n=1 Tax=Novosphingobium sp. TaxID=1874826 RepID=UPI0025EC1B15|nr:hypothetical protein [Novosphingobium sp.]